MEQFNFDKEDCRHYISLLQTNINRMASNSANCKAWLAGIIAALTAIQYVSDKMPWIFLVAIIPLIIFYLLDSYYLGLEKRFIILENNFIELLKLKKNFDQEIYVLGPRKVGSDLKYTLKGMKSWSTGPFYLAFLAILIALFYHFQ